MICSYCGHEIVDDAAFCPYCATPVEGAEECTDFEYEAFISYRHLPRDREVALKLQKAIEGFSIPKHLRVEDGPARLGKLFRDEDELPTSSSLSDQIRDALKHSRFLFVVCSPQTNESQWVARELELFSSYHGRDKIRIVLAEAEPDDSFPTLLRTRLERNMAGELVVVDEEPLAADFRDLSRKHVNVERLRLIAPLLGCGFDDLRQRMRARRTRIAASAAAVVTAVSVAFGSFSTYQQFQIQENYRQMQINESEALATEANELFAAGDRMQAIQVSLAALPESEANPNRPYVSAAQLALENALEIYPSTTYWRSCYSLENTIGVLPVVGENGYVASLEGGQVLVIDDLETGAPLCTIDLWHMLDIEPGSASVIDAFAFAGDNLLYVFDEQLACFDAVRGELEWVLHIDDFSKLMAYAVSPDETRIAVVTQPYGGSEGFDGTRFLLHVIDAKKGTEVKQMLLPSTGGEREVRLQAATALCFIDEDTVALAGGRGLFVVDLESGDVKTGSTQYSYATAVDCFDSQLYVTSTNSVVNRIYVNQEFAIEAFDSALGKLWDFVGNPADTVSTKYSIHGLYYLPHVAVCGAYRAESFDRTQILVMFDNAMMLLDSTTGETSFRVETATPLAACAAVEESGKCRIIACSCAGELIWRNPSTSESSGRIYDTSIEPCYSAEIVTTSTRGSAKSYLVLYNADQGQRIYRFSDPSHVEEALVMEDMGESSGYYWSDVDARLYEVNDRELISRDADTFEPVFTVSLADLPELDGKSPTVTPGPNGHVYVYADLLASKLGHAAVAMYVLSADDGSILASYLIDDSGWDARAAGSWPYELDGGSDGPVISLWGGTSIRFYDAFTGELRQSMSCEARLENVWYAGNRLVACESWANSLDESSARCVLLDSATGNEIESALGEFTPNSSSSDPVAGLAEDDMRFVLWCSDGYVRMFDLTTGALLWKTGQDFASLSYLFISPIDGNVMLQDGSGICMLLSGKDGSILRASSTALPTIVSDYGLIDGTSLAVRWQQQGLAGDMGLAIISLDSDLFGPKCNIYGGFFPARNDASVLVRTKGTHVITLVHRYTLDELISHAHEVIQGHELTDAERHLYRIADL